MSRFSKEEVNNIIKLYKEGMSQKEIANLYSTYNTSIRRILIRNNVKIRGEAASQAYVKKNPFKRNDEKSDYFLGLLLTDGCISNNKISLSLKEGDVYILEEFAKFCSPKLQVTKYYHSVHNKFQYSVHFKDSRRIVIGYLEKLGRFTNKSYECKLYKPVNYNILRGIIDGDGSIYSTNRGKSLRVSICSKSKDFINQIAYFYQKEGYGYFINQRKDGLYYIHVDSKEDLLRLGYNLYHDAHIFLKRKYERWSHFAEMQRQNNTLNSGNEMAI
jgi:hypothetical protein